MGSIRVRDKAERIAGSSKTRICINSIEHQVTFPVVLKLAADLANVLASYEAEKGPKPPGKTRA